MSNRIKKNNLFSKPVVFALVIWAMCIGSYSSSAAWLRSSDSSRVDPYKVDDTYWESSEPAPAPRAWYAPEDIDKPQKPDELAEPPDGDYVEGPSGWYYFKDGNESNTNQIFFNLWTGVSGVWYDSSVNEGSAWLKVDYSLDYFLWYNVDSNIWIETGNLNYCPNELKADPQFAEHGSSSWRYIFDLAGFYNEETFAFTLGFELEDSEWFRVAEFLWYNKAGNIWSEYDPNDIFAVGMSDDMSDDMPIPELKFPEPQQSAEETPATSEPEGDDDTVVEPDASVETDHEYEDIDNDADSSSNEFDTSDDSENQFSDDDSDISDSDSGSSDSSDTDGSSDSE